MKTCSPLCARAAIAIRGLRYREDLTQAQLAEKIGVKRHHISEMEHGKRPIGKEMAKRLARALRTDYTLFLQKAVPESREQRSLARLLI